MTTPLFLISYRNTPYSRQSQAEICILRNLVSEIQDIQATYLQLMAQFSNQASSHSECFIPQTERSFSVLEDPTFSEVDLSADKELEELEKMLLLKEQKLKEEKNKTKTLCSRLLKSFLTQFEAKEINYKKKLQDLHNQLGSLTVQTSKQKQLETSQKALLQELSPHIIKVETASEIFLVSNNTHYQELEDLINCYTRYVELHDKIIDQKPSSDTEHASETTAPPKPKESFQQPIAKPSPLGKTKKSKKQEEDDFLEKASLLSTVMQASPAAASSKKKIPMTEFAFHQDEIRKILKANLKDCLSNPLSIFQLKERFLVDAEKPLRPHRELVCLVKAHLRSPRECFQLFQSLEAEKKEILLVNMSTKSEISIEQILSYTIELPKSTTGPKF